MEQDIRWKQRFASFEKSFEFLAKYFKNEKELSALEKHGLIHSFSSCFELSSDVLSDYLHNEGHTIILDKRDIIRKSFNLGIISEAQTWMDMIESRNKTVHTYHENILEVEFDKIVKKYYPLFQAFYLKMKTFL